MTDVSSLTHDISINPATGEQIGHYPFESDGDGQTRCAGTR